MTNPQVRALEYGGPSTNVKIEVTSLLAAQLAMLVSSPEIEAQAREWPLAYAGLIEFRDRVEVALRAHEATTYALLPRRNPDPVDPDGSHAYLKAVTGGAADAQTAGEALLPDLIATRPTALRAQGSVYASPNVLGRGKGGYLPRDAQAFFLDGFGAVND